MEYFRCRCGQPLAAFVTDGGGFGAPIAREYVERQVEAAFRRHLAGLPERPPNRFAGHGLAGVDTDDLVLSVDRETWEGAA